MKTPINTDALLCVVRDVGDAVMTKSGPAEVARMLSQRFMETFDAAGTTTVVLGSRPDTLEVKEPLGRQFGFDKWTDAEWIDRAIDLKKSTDLLVMAPNRPARPDDPPEAETPEIILDLVFPFHYGRPGFIRLYFEEIFEFTQELTNTFTIMIHQGACAMEKSRLIKKQRQDYNNLAATTEKLSALGRLAAGVAHEINNPLAGILLFSTNLLKKAEPDSDMHAGLKIITDEVIRCKTIIQELLNFSREREPTRTRANLNDIVRKAAMIVDNEYRLRHIIMDMNLTVDLPEVIVDPGQIEQVAVNLLLNAAESGEKGGRVEVGTRLGQDGKSVILEVTDNGEGIEERHLPNIFDPFFSTKSHGTGLGLAVTFGLIQNHGGTIDVDSSPGQGATFTVLLPLDGKAKAGSGDV